MLKKKKVGGGWEGVELARKLANRMPSHPDNLSALISSLWSGATRTPEKPEAHFWIALSTSSSLPWGCHCKAPSDKSFEIQRKHFFTVLDEFVHFSLL